VLVMHARTRRYTFTKNTEYETIAQIKNAVDI
jgi:tRNA-dihydrouridine synthase